MDVDGQETMTVDFAQVPAAEHASGIGRLCDAMEATDKAGWYPELTVVRPWSVHNPRIEGEFAAPRAIRWYLERELARLAAHGARISVSRGREAVDLHDARLGAAVDETRWDLRRKKLFLFAPERMALSMDRLQHYTGTSPELFFIPASRLSSDSTRSPSWAAMLRASPTPAIHHGGNASSATGRSTQCA